MKSYIVTVRLDKNPEHDPHNKQVGFCPATALLGYMAECSDVTGEHHSFVYEEANFTTAEMVHRNLSGRFHVTRVEEADH